MARSRYRSVTYNLSMSIELARAVQSAGGRTDMAGLADALSYSGVRNGAFLTRLANARLFGLVAGRSGEVTLLERGRRCLSADPSEAQHARAEAFLAVPLFRDVLGHYRDAALPAPDVLAQVLEREFGESSNRATTTAKVLAESAGQAGLVTADERVIDQLNGEVTDLTDSRLVPRRPFIPPVGLGRGSLYRRADARRQRGVGRGGLEVADKWAGNRGAVEKPEQSGLWIDEETGAGRRRDKGSRRAWVTVGAAACLLVVGLPVGLLVASGSSPTAPHQPPPHPNVAIRLGDGPAKRSALAALSATTDSGNFSFAYVLSESPATSTTTTTTATTAVPVCPSHSGVGPVTSCGIGLTGPATYNTTVQGSGTINTNPMAMAASAQISQNGNSGLDVGVRVNPTSVWEVGSTDNGLTPQTVNSGVNGGVNSATGQSLPDFAGITEGTLGNREGAVAMMGMASPTGYLDLVEPAVSGAAQVGTSTVDGVAATQYQLAIDPSSLSTAPNVTSEEASTIQSAIALLTSQGFTTIRDLISVDASGFIRESSSTVSFSDGGTVTLDAHLSNFGCAGTVLMPGTSGVSTPPANCTSPDTGVAPGTASTTTTSTTQAPTSSTSTTSTTPTTTTSSPPSSTTTTSTPASTTTTTAKG